MTKLELLPRAALTILCALALTACAPTRVRLSPLPAELTTCADEPGAPALPPVTGPEAQAMRDLLMLDYVLAWRSAWGDCRAKVDGAKAWNAAITR